MLRFVAGISLGYWVGRLIAPDRGDRFRHNISNRVRAALHAVRPEGAEPVTTGTLAYALNEATVEELRSVHGIGKGLARRIMRHRPFRTGQELLEEQLVPEATFERLKEKFELESAVG